MFLVIRRCNENEVSDATFGLGIVQSSAQTILLFSRVIMASASDYFKAMFTGESHQTRGGYILLSKLITVVVLFLYVVFHPSKIMIHFIFVPYWLSVKMFYLV